MGHNRSKVVVGMIEIVYHIALQTEYNLRLKLSQCLGTIAQRKRHGGCSGT